MATVSLTRQRPMTFEEYVAFEQAAGVRHEFVDGVPRMMAGGTRAHETIVGNVFAALRERLRGSGCQAFAANFKLRLPNGDVRYPDGLVDCGKGSARDLAATEPVLVVEVLSPSTRWFDQSEKLADYKSVPTIRMIILLSQDRAVADVHRRTGDATWTSGLVVGADAVIAVPDLGIELPLAAFYEGVAFEAEGEAAAG